MCIDFLVMFWHVHRFFGEVPNMCNDYLRKLPACAMIIDASSQHVQWFSAEVSNMCAATFGELPACLLAKFQTCLSILLGNSQHVHDFLADVPNMCTDFLGEFPTCACFLGGKFESPMSTGILGSSKCPLISWVISHMTNCFVEVEESSKCITFSLGTCLSSIGFQV